MALDGQTAQLRDARESRGDPGQREPAPDAFRETQPAEAVVHVSLGCAQLQAWGRLKPRGRLP
eukprot:5234941-Lingulodinium_polyedra.AAC.1